MSAQIQSLMQSAQVEANNGRMDRAASYWAKVLTISPDHADANLGVAVQCLNSGDPVGAIEHLNRAAASAPKNPMVRLTLASALRAVGDERGEGAAIQDALAIDPYFLPGLLSKAALLERKGNVKAAATMFKNALKVAPPEQHWPSGMRTQLAIAKSRVNAYTEAFASHLRDKLSTSREALEGAVLERWTEAADILAGRTKPYLQDCNTLHVPRLPPIPFFDRKQFAWVPELESQTKIILEELQNALAKRRQDFEPYISYRPGDPVNQWVELNNSKRWSALHLWKAGKSAPEGQELCPLTCGILESLEMAKIPDFCPNAMFSALEPHTEIPPHHGETNARVIVHLPLIVPEKCTYRVGYEKRSWKVGEALIFDDTIEHTARNDSDELRVVMIFDVWNPLLSLAERDIVCAAMTAAREYHAEA